ncbi:exopolysaccharide biosynthesis polyprenyl glycosylphosphotransferase [Candidatus Electronema sp. JC]|uniref:exopolysaccharide biosynthesis polyprenyl glycosylphosphotransferase n=1 Tax=Candidatus Electronema sp. JC TaxID=3401570 RepID=UPI003B434FE5
MNKPPLSLRALRWAEICTDFFAFFASVIGAFGLHRLIVSQPLPEGLGYYIQLGLLAGFVGTMTFHFIGLHRHQASMMNLLETRKIIKTTLLLFLLLIVYSFFARAAYSRIVLFLSFGLSLLLLTAGRFVFFKITQRHYLRGIHVRRALIFGAGEAGRLLCQSILHTPKLGYLPVAFFDPAAEQEQLRDLGGSVRLITDINECLKIIEEEDIRDIFLSHHLHERQHGDGLDLFRRCQVDFHVMPHFQPLFTKQVELNLINGIPLLSFREIPARALEAALKRGFDLAVAGLLLLLAAPLLLLIALLIKADSPGPVLFRQQRIGKDGVPFIMYKFRSMFTQAPVFHHSPSGSDDPRITRAGRWLRKTSLDELPQLFNVLNGSMSLVGPRPEMEFIVKGYNELCRQRLRVKPGITGIWQISADRTREIHEDISYDLFYIANQSLLLDLLILIRTVPALLIMRTW